MGLCDVTRALLYGSTASSTDLLQALTSTCEWFPWALTVLLELGSPLRGRGRPPT